jgi:hypothetical protein
VVDFGLGGLLFPELFVADATGAVFRGGIASKDDPAALESAMSNLQNELGTSIVLGVGPDVDRNGAPHRDARILADGTMRRFDLKPIRNSTIAVGHSARQAVNLLRKFLLRRDAGGHQERAP